HVDYIGQAAKQGAKVMCLQELFYGPYFCQVQDTKHYSYTEKIPDGPTTKLMQELAKKHSMVLIAPMYEEDQAGIYYNTAAIVDADGKYLGKYRKTHIPHVNGFWEQFYFRPGNLADPRGKIVAQASDKEEQLLVADLDMDLVREVRNTWQFYRDRRPDMYDDLVRP